MEVEQHQQQDGNQRDIAGHSPREAPLKTAAEVAAARLAETVEAERDTAPAAGDGPMRRRGRSPGDMAGVFRRYPATSLLIVLGIGLGIGLLVGRRGQTHLAAGA